MVSAFLRATVGAVLLITLSSGAFAEEKKTEDWPKYEEKALRPYKALFRGIKALGHHTKASFIEGNTRVPIIGTVEVFRGVRKGAVEIVSGTTMGMAGSKPKPYTELSKPNQIIDSEPFLSTAADFAVPAGIGTLASGAETGLKFAVGTFATQKFVDSDPTSDRWLDDEEHAGDRVANAQKRYIGDRAEVNKKKNGTGNLLKLARK